MPSGRTHSFLTTGLLVPTFVAGTYFAIIEGQPEVLFVSLGIASTLLVNPDQDLFEARKNKNLWEWFWYPYAKSIKHRSVWSHGILIGTLLRFIYIGWPLFFISGINWRIVLWIIIGAIISDSVHSVTDLVTTRVKVNWNKRRKRNDNRKLPPTPKNLRFRRKKGRRRFSG